jgi:hypothetical protein
MSLTRREALIAILLAPSGAPSMLVQEKKDQFGGSIAVLSSGMRLMMTLADKEDSAREGGIFELEIKYKNEVQTFSAKEIWEALRAGMAEEKEQG